MQWYDDALISQIMRGQKTATVRPLDAALDSYNTALHCGAVHSVHDKAGSLRCHIRVTGINLVNWGAIPDALWQRDPPAIGVASLEAFKADHWDFFGQPSDDFAFLAIYFDLATEAQAPAR